MNEIQRDELLLSISKQLGDIKESIVGVKEDLRKEFKTEMNDLRTNLRKEFKTEMNNLRTSLRKEFKTEMNDLRTSLRQEFKTELKTAIDDLRTELLGEIYALNEKMNIQFKQLNDELVRQRKIMAKMEENLSNKISILFDVKEIHEEILERHEKDLNSIKEDLGIDREEAYQT